jgi:hypothetical protein
MAAVQASTSGVVSFNGRTGIVDLLDTDITNAGGALLVSPVFTGTPQAPTATAGTDTGQLATCAFVLNELGGASIGVMTFNTRAGAVVLTSADITGAGGALLAGPAFSGIPTAPTAASGVATQQLATTAFVAAAISALSIGVSSFNSRTGAVTLTTNDISAAGGAVLASPIFSGQPTAPTASPGTSTTQLATTAFVTAAIAAAPIVSSFNGRAGAVTLTAADVSAAGGPYLPMSGGNLTGNLGVVPASGNGQLAVVSAASSALVLQAPAAQNKILTGQVGANGIRWQILLGDSAAETGSNAGSNFDIVRFSDAGASIDYPLSIARTSGNISCIARVTAANGFFMNPSYGLVYDTAASIFIYTGGVQTTQFRSTDMALVHLGSFAAKTGGGAWADSSDSRIKTVAGNYESGLDAILKLQPVVYTYKGNDTDKPSGRGVPPYADSPHHHAAEAGQRYVGLVAQHVETVMPEMVTQVAGFIDGKPVTDLRNLDTTPLIFALVNATKQLAARVAALETVRSRA